MTVNHQYIVGTDTCSGASEVVIEPTWATGITEGSQHVPIQVVRRGSLVTISGFMEVASTITTNSTLTTLPTGFRPEKIVPLVGRTKISGVEADVVFNLTSAGDLKNDSHALTQYFYLNVTFHVIDGS